MKKLLACLLMLILPVVSFAWTPRTITDPAAGSALSSATMRTALQTLENEIANMFATTTSGVSTSTIVGFLGGMFSVGSSTIQDLHATNLTFSALTSGGLAVNSSGLVYKAATTTFTGSTGLTYANGNVTCDVATDSIPGCLSAADWTIFNNKAGFAWPFTNSASWISTTTLMNFPTGGIMSTASSTLQNLHTSTLTMEDSASAYGVAIGFTNTTMAGNQTLTIDTGNYSPTLTFQGAAGNPTLGDWFNQSVKTTASPSFTGLTIGTLNGLIAGNAGLTYAAASSTLYATLGNNGGLGLNTSGVVYKYATTTFSTGLTYAAGAVTCTTGTLSVFGCLAGADFTNFNNKVSSTSLSGASVISYTSSTGVITTAGGTFGAGNYIFPSGVSAVTATATTQLVAPIPRAYGRATTTMGSGTTTGKLPGEPFAKTYVSIGANAMGGGTFVCQFGDSTASTSIVSSTGLTTTFSTLSSNNAFTAGETIWFAIGSVSGTVVDPSCTVQ